MGCISFSASGRGPHNVLADMHFPLREKALAPAKSALSLVTALEAQLGFWKTVVEPPVELMRVIIRAKPDTQASSAGNIPGTGETFYRS